MRIEQFQQLLLYSMAAILALTGCVSKLSTPVAQTFTSVPTPSPTRRTLPPSPTPRQSRPSWTPKPLPPSPTPTRIACNLDGPYVGAITPFNNPVWLVNILADCYAYIPLRQGGDPRGTLFSFGNWLPDGSGFVYVKGIPQGGWRKVSDVCIWDLAQRATTRCLITKGDTYWKALWSPGNTNYIAYERFEVDLDREFVTVAKAESGEVIYETDISLLENGTAERLLDWHPDGKHLLISVSNKTEQLAVVLDVETGSRHVLAAFDGEDKVYLVKGLWIRGGAGAVLGLVDPIYYRNADANPEAQDLYWVKNDGTGLKLLLKSTAIGPHTTVGLYIEDSVHNRLLLGTSDSPHSMYWLDWQHSTFTNVLGDNVENNGLYPMGGLTPDGRYIITLNGQLENHLVDVETGEIKQLKNVMVEGLIVWRPHP